MEESETLVRTSERSKFKDCRQAWWWSYVENLKPVREKVAFRFGSDAHKVLELRYPPGRKRGPKPATIAKRLWMERRKEHGDEADYTVKVGKNEHPADELLVHMMENYYEEYGDDERYEVLASEMTFQVEVHHPKTGTYLFTYVGTIDGVWIDLWYDTLVFAEHKTGAGLEPFGAPIYLDEQQASYWAYGPIWVEHQGIIQPGQEIDHILYNRLRKGFKDERPQNAKGLYLNKDGSVSKNQGTPLFKREQVMRTPEERARTMRRVISEAREMRLVRAGKLKVYKRPDRHCGYCEFREMCEVHESGGDWKALRKRMFKEWDPYEDHTDERVEDDG